MPHPSPVARLLSHRLLPVVLVAVAASASLAALLVQDDALDTALGAVTGGAVVLAVAAVLVQVVVARVERRAVDRKALDGLEPLRAARREDRQQ